MRWQTLISQCKENSFVLLMFYTVVNFTSIIFSAVLSATYQVLFTDTNFYGWQWYECIGMSFLYAIIAIGLSFIFPLPWILHISTGIFAFKKSFKFLYISVPIYSLIGMYIPNWAVISMGV
jgi:hypothetical protein